MRGRRVRCSSALPGRETQPERRARTKQAPSGSRRHRQFPFKADTIATVVVVDPDREQSEHMLSLGV